MQQPRFNIALLPTDAALNQRFMDFSQAKFSDASDGYLLGKTALPHVTLCQFRAPDEDAARQAFISWKAPEAPRTLTLETLGLRDDNGKCWAAFTVHRGAGLMRLQKSCHDHLAGRGLECLTPSETYDPHFTMARLGSRPQAVPTAEEWANLPPIPVATRIGASGETGMFLGVLPPRPSHHPKNRFPSPP